MTTRRQWNKLAVYCLPCKNRNWKTGEWVYRVMSRFEEVMLKTCHKALKRVWGLARDTSMKVAVGSGGAWRVRGRSVGREGGSLEGSFFHSFRPGFHKAGSVGSARTWGDQCQHLVSRCSPFLPLKPSRPGARHGGDKLRLSVKGWCYWWKDPRSFIWSPNTLVCQFPVLVGQHSSPWQPEAGWPPSVHVLTWQTLV